MSGHTAAIRLRIFFGSLILHKTGEKRKYNPQAWVGESRAVYFERSVSRQRESERNQHTSQNIRS